MLLSFEKFLLYFLFLICLFGSNTGYCASWQALYHLFVFTFNIFIWVELFVFIFNIFIWVCICSAQTCHNVYWELENNTQVNSYLSPGSTNSIYSLCHPIDHINLLWHVWIYQYLTKTIFHRIYSFLKVPIFKGNYPKKSS